MWLGGKEGGSRKDKMVDSVMGVRKPVFKRQYCATRLNGHSVYHSISMMMVSSIWNLCGVFSISFPLCSPLSPSLPPTRPVSCPPFLSHTMITPLRNFVYMPLKWSGKNIHVHACTYNVCVNIDVCMYMYMCMYIHVVIGMQVAVHLSYSLNQETTTSLSLSLSLSLSGVQRICL